MIWLLIFFSKFDLSRSAAIPAEQSGNTASRLWYNRHYRYGVLAQFFNVAAQTCAWTFTILYAQDVVGVSPENAGWWLQASLIIFLISRFVMTWLLGIVPPTRLLFIMAVFGMLCCLTAMFALNIVGLVAVVAISASLSLMFPTIYGVALQGLGDDAKFGAAGLVMAILGGALAPMVHGVVMDEMGAAMGFIVPGICLAFVAAYAVLRYDTRAAPGDCRFGVSGAMRINVMTGTATNRWQRPGFLLALAMVVALAACSDGEEKVTIGLITKQEANPYWVTLREVAEDTAEDNAVDLLTATSWSDVDLDSQQTALQNAWLPRVHGAYSSHLPTPTALVPAIEAARKKGVVVIAVDTPVEPVDAVDAYYATDNEAARRLHRRVCGSQGCRAGTGSEDCDARPCARYQLRCGAA